MPIVHDPKTGQFASNGGAAAVGTASKVSAQASGGNIKGEHGVEYPASSVTTLPAGAKSFKELRGEPGGSKLHKVNEGDPVKVKVQLNGKEVVFHAKSKDNWSETPGATAAVELPAIKMGKAFQEYAVVLKSQIYPAD